MAGAPKTAFQRPTPATNPMIQNRPMISAYGIPNLGAFRPAQGSFAPGSPDSGWTPGAGGWSTKVASGFAHPQNPMRMGIGAGLMGVPGVMQAGGSNMGGFDTSVLQRLMAMKSARRV